MMKKTICFLGLLLLLGFSAQAEALTETMTSHLADDIYTKASSSNNAELCLKDKTDNLSLNAIVKESIKGYDVKEPESTKFVEGFVDSIKDDCTLVGSDINAVQRKQMIKNGVEAGNKSLATKLPEQEQFDKILNKIEALKVLVGKNKKQILIPEEVEQIEYMVHGTTMTSFCEDNQSRFESKSEAVCDDTDDKCSEFVVKAYTELCKNNQYELPNMTERLNFLGDSFYSKASEKKRFKDLPNQTEKINDLLTKLNHADWQNDMYWVGGSVMSVPSIKAMTTGIAFHAYLGYARAIQSNLSDMHELGRRFSVYLDVGNISGNANFTGSTYGVGFGFDIRKGFILKAGGVYKKSSSATGEYGYNNTVGISITSEFFKELMGK